MNQSALHIQKALIASLLKLQGSTYLSDSELQWLRGSVMRMVSEFAVLKQTESERKSEHEETHAA
jgi:hypothetical protein